MSQIVKVGGIFILLISMLLSAASCFAAESASLKSIVDDGFFGCTTEEALSDTVGYLANKEKSLFVGQFIEGKCTTFKKGEKVVLVDVKFLGNIRIRRLNDSAKYFTVPGAVK